MTIGPWLRADHVDAADVEAEGGGGAQGHLPFLVGEFDFHCRAAAVEVGRNSPGRPMRFMAATTSPPTTSARMSDPFASR